MSSNKALWKVVGDSVIGLSHKEEDKPRQDRFLFGFPKSKSWGVAVIADGAGSALHSHIGAEFVVKQVYSLLSNSIQKKRWGKRLPSSTKWHRHIKDTFQKVTLRLESYAQRKHIAIKQLYCTVIVVVFTPKGLLTAHVGDGRGAYCTLQGQWQPFMIPWKGDEAHSTVFLTPFIFKEKERIDTYVRSHVIREQVTGFALMSDGCEKFAYRCYEKDEATGLYYDPNIPFTDFFEPVTHTLQQIFQEHHSRAIIANHWRTFLENGNNLIARQRDDKTMIIGVRFEPTASK